MEKKHVGYYNTVAITYMVSLLISSKPVTPPLVFNNDDKAFNKAKGSVELLSLIFAFFITVIVHRNTNFKP